MKNKNEIEEEVPATITPEEAARLPSTVNENADTDLATFYEDETADDAGIDYIPVLKIEQGTEHPGELFSPDMGQYWDELTLALLKETKSRVLWPEDFDKENMPLCRSHNGVTPAGDIPEDPESEEEDIVFLPTMADTCEECEYARWNKNKKGKTKPPRCQDVRNLLVLDMESNVPFFYSVYSIALSPYNKQLRKPLALRKMALGAKRAKAGLAPAHISMFMFTLKTELDVRSSGSAYKPVFSDIAELDEDLKEFTGSVAMQLRKFTIRDTKDGVSGPENATPEGVASEDDDF